MPILVIYASIEGQTRKIATHIAEHLEDAGRRVVLADVRDTGFAVPGQFEGVVLCAPIHVGRYPSAFVRFICDWKDALQAVPTAFVSVTLGIKSGSRDDRDEAMAFPSALAEKTGFSANMVHHAAGALKYLEYDFFKRFVMRQIAGKEGGPVDPSRDYEFTDWPALDAFADAFLEAIGND